jgi:cation diffusion facilitator family transporter
LKACAYWLTGSVGLLSDALESLVNLVTASVALVVLTIAARSADEEHPYGHDKAEYFSSGVEGGMILLAALSIAATALNRLLHPQPLEQVGLGLTVSMIASLINFGIARTLFAAGRRCHSITLEAEVSSP